MKASGAGGNVKLLQPHSILRHLEMLHSYFSFSKYFYIYLNFDWVFLEVAEGRNFPLLNGVVFSFR